MAKREPAHLDAVRPAPTVTTTRQYFDGLESAPGLFVGETAAPAEMAPSPVPEPESAPVAPSRALSLYQHEDWLLALRDTAEGLTEDQETERLAILDEIAVSTDAARRKRDGVARYLRELDAIEERGKTEAAWIRGQLALMAKHRERVRAYVARLVEEYAPEPANGAKQLAGETYALALRRNPDTVAITDEDAVPDQYKRVTVTMPAETWNALLHCAESFDADWDVKTTAQVVRDVQLRAVKAAIDAGAEVQGADIEFGTVGLTVRMRR